jgi:hypothetical protein
MLIIRCPKHPRYRAGRLTKCDVCRVLYILRWKDCKFMDDQTPFSNVRWSPKLGTEDCLMDLQVVTTEAGSEVWE